MTRDTSSRQGKPEARSKRALESAAERPEALPVNPDGIPAELRERPQWVCWRQERRQGKKGEWKWTKVPVDPRTGGNASCDDPRTWGRFEDALGRYRSDRLDGIGYEFSADDPFCGVDFDDCRDPDTGDITEWGGEVIAKLDSYAEVSPSGTGAKAIVRARKPAPRCKKKYKAGKVEIYERSRFFALTGHRLGGAPASVNGRQAQLEEVYFEVFGGAPAAAEATSEAAAFREAAPDAQQAPPPFGGAPLTDAELIARARAAKNGAKFSRLFDSDPEDSCGYPSSSEADQALANILSYWTHGDRGRIERLFGESGRGKREKWAGRADYRRMTLDKALSGCKGGPPPPSGGGGTAAQAGPPNAYQIILSFFRETYGDGSFRMGNAVFAASLGREVKAGEACFAPRDELVNRLLNAVDCPKDDDNRGKRSAVPRLYKLWAGTAWADFIHGLEEEEDSAEINEAAREHFRGLVKSALYHIVVLGRHVSTGPAGFGPDGAVRDGYETRQERRSFKDFCALWAKERWEKGKIRSYEIWARKDPDGTLRIALRHELFEQISKPLAAMSSGKFKRLCERYDVGRETFVLRKRVIELSQEYLAEHLTEDCERPDGGAAAKPPGQGLDGEGI